VSCGSLAILGLLRALAARAGGFSVLKFFI